eukprot:3277696-Pyramimonas_sp.AAC.1
MDVKAWQMKLLADGTHADVSRGIFVSQLRRWFAKGVGSSSLAEGWEPLNCSQRGYARSVFVLGQWPNSR